jgi:AAA domain
MSRHRRLLEEEASEVTESLKKHIRNEEPLAVVQAPPGSGKTYLLMEAVKEAYRKRQRVAIATQTRSQADSICRRIIADPFRLPVIRFVARHGQPADLPTEVQQIGDQKELPNGPSIVVATTAKWGTIELARPFDVLFVEEAWQMAWADFMLLGQVAPRFVLIGDPGQIPPVVAVDAARWETAPRPPHRAAPELVLQGRRLGVLALSLPATRRLPVDTAGLIQPFYDFQFSAWAEADGRQLRPGRAGSGPQAAVVDRLTKGSIVGVTLPTPEGGAPLECDGEIAALAVEMAVKILHRQPECFQDGKCGPLSASDIGLCATHHVMNAQMALEQQRHGRKLKGMVIDTPERWQGLERKVMVVVHPLSGVVNPSAFDLETGRLCVMASRHEISLVVVARDHLADTLSAHLPVAEQAVGRPDISGRGHHQNFVFWNTLLEQDRVIQLKAEI